MSSVYEKLGLDSGNCNINGYSSFLLCSIVASGSKVLGLRCIC